MQYTQEFTKGLSIEDFKSDDKTQFAVIRCLEIIGEASKRIPDDFRESNSSIPWKAMAGIRDRLIHGYDVVDYEIIWTTVTRTIPKLITSICELV
ncbi:DUF86 domain-containing protein [Thiospirochaeta perfilievii]|uniref:DUF86 domain-containing protein n=1 Tax=Thiospirochaeta perfilievii TaxID=252967 RepID=A0A5C1QB47_9SPIO|nr:DUF86 domain-containing protein [Thiospirochaeta perfilievii]QEN03382.1 DUF86 domain-containing protein [Thiospirochaeta perfilievii]